MKINIDSLLTFFYRKNEKYLYILFFFISHFFFAQTPVTQTISTTGAGIFMVPCDVTSITVELWGAGGGGQAVNAKNTAGGGGAGGGFVKMNYSVVPGATYSYYVGRGGTGDDTRKNGEASWFINNTTIKAVGGTGAGNVLASGTGAGAINIIDASNQNLPTTGVILSTYGGNGASGISTNSGGGGSSAGNVNGNDAIGMNGGLDPINGYIGGSGKNSSSIGGAGGIGAGGGGAFATTGQTNYLGGSGGNGQIKITYTTKYCNKSFTSDVEPITNVTFAGINNTTSGTINGSASNEYFCATSASVLKGDAYTISLSGNTNGNNTNNFRVYIDWDQNGVFGNNANEIYDIGTITNVSSGSVMGSIAVPATALVGNTTMRVIKNRGAITDPCAATLYGQSEDYIVVVSEPTCSVSSGGTASVSPTSGNPTSVFTASVSGSSNNTVAYTYQWEKSPDNFNWSTIAGATSPTASITSESTSTTYYYRRKITCVSSGSTYYSSSVSYTTTLTYCTPTFNTSNTGKLYIKSFKYIGVLNDDFLTANVSTQSGTNGVYQDFTGLTPKAQQVRGSVVNVESICTGTVSSGSTVGWGYWMAWVDWNRDGTFSSSEVVYSLQNYSTGSVTFGFIIPANQALGDYRIRIAVMSVKTTSSCGLSTSYGEVEDYVFSVVEDNNAKLDTSKPSEFSRCDVGVVPMIVYGSDANAVDFKWYDAKYGGNLLFTGANYAPNLSATTTFYVSVVDTNGKETPFRYPILARIDPIPQVTFTPTPETICGEDDPYLLLSVWGDNREVTLLDEKFDAGLGAFYNVVADTYLGTNTTPYSYNWTVKASPYAQTNPPHEAIASSVSSGYFGGNFAIMNSDGAERINKNVLRHLVTTSTYDTTLFLPNQIKLDFDLYYFSIALIETDGYFKVEYSIDGTNWVSFKTYVLNTGNPLFWNKVSIDLDASGVPRSSNLLIRFSLYSRGFSSGYYESVATLDNIKLHGNIPLDRDFDWSGADNVVLYDKTCTTPLGNTLAREVCVKPPLDEFEKPFWTIQASATFLSGCPAVGTTVVYNDTKVWREPGMIDWNQGDKWKPSNVPDIKKCVIIRTPVELPTNTNGTHGLARSVIVKSGGKLLVKPKSSLEIQNYIKNESLAGDVVVDSDANLKQNNDAAVNIGNVTVKRISNMKRLDYTYWGPPVNGQNLRNFSPNTLTSRFYVYNETTNYFDGIFVRNIYPTGVYSTTSLENTSTYNFVPGKGYAIRAPNDYTTDKVNFEGVFVGVPNNGGIPIQVMKNGLGYNLISNPYPSNVNFETFFTLNQGNINKIAYFWTNTNFNPEMQGNEYPKVGYINNYAVYTGVGGVAAPYGFDPSRPPAVTPNNIIKPGQGFVIRAHTPGTIYFYNNTRDKSNQGAFFNTFRAAQVTKDRFWIELKTPLNFVSPILIGYVQGSTDGFDVNYDAPIMVEGADSFYTILDNEKLVIEGRNYPLSIEDKVSLGATFYESGIHEISLSKVEGVFASGQQIYLYDKKENIYANLSNESYKFYAESGDDRTRFQIVYKPGSVLSTGEVNKKEVIIYKNADDFVIEAGDVIESVKVYDASGKLLRTFKSSNLKKLTIQGHMLNKGVSVLEIKVSEKIITKKIIK